MRFSSCYLAVALVACVDSAGPELGETKQLVDTTNGKSLNGRSLNGKSLNGTGLSGQTLASVAKTGTTSSGGSISATTSGASPAMSGTAFVGATFTGTTSGGVSLPLHIDSGAALAAPNTDVWGYNVSYQTSTGWLPLCTDAAGAVLPAIAVQGIWATTATDTAKYTASSTAFTFACRTYSVAKCVELGYKTWKGYANQMAACVRLLRADYCGTGTSYTTDGTLLNVYDKVGIQLDTETWKQEAAWSTTGATCLRSGTTARWQLAGYTAPSCVAAKTTTTCGSTFGAADLLIDEL